jgi:hypothetical protein
MTIKLLIEFDHEPALISYAKADHRLICATKKLFGVSVNIKIDEMRKLMEQGKSFAEVEDSTCAIGFQLDTFGDDPLYCMALWEADQMRDIVMQYGMPEAIDVWAKRNGS